jgi:hypothetical protein
VSDRLYIGGVLVCNISKVLAADTASTFTLYLIVIRVSDMSHSYET